MIVIIMTHIFNNLGFYSSFVPSSAIITLFITIFLVIPRVRSSSSFSSVCFLPPSLWFTRMMATQGRNFQFLSRTRCKEICVFFHKRAVCHEVTSKSISFCQLWLWPLTLNTKGGIHVPIRINFWKSSKRS